MNQLWRKVLRILWYPAPFISDSAMMKVLWVLPPTAFVLFIVLVAFLSAGQ